MFTPWMSGVRVPHRPKSHGQVGPTLPPNGGDSEAVAAEFARSRTDVDAPGARLQDEGVGVFVTSWNGLLKVPGTKCAARAKPGRSLRHPRCKSTARRGRNDQPHPATHRSRRLEGPRSSLSRCP